jgi:NAD-dependent deacetylase
MIADLEKIHQDFHLITQNVDGLHQRAGSCEVIELHGSLWSLKCTVCNAGWRDVQVPFHAAPPTCPACGSLARPDVVWFGEALNPDILHLCFELSSRAKTMLVIGTSGIVQPAAHLPLLASEHGARLIEINPDETPLTNRMDEVYRMSAADGIERWLQDRGYDPYRR